jgi:hypothetical protein
MRKKIIIKKMVMEKILEPNQMRLNLLNRQMESSNHLPNVAREHPVDAPSE